MFNNLGDLLTNVKISKSNELYDFKTDFIKNAAIENTGRLIDLIEASPRTLIPDECREEIITMRNITEIIRNAKNTDEIIFYSAKEIANHFTNIREKCHVPLPDVKTDKWSFDKFRQFKCGLIAISMAKETLTCIHGNIFDCGKTILSINTLATCIKLILNIH